MYFVARATNPSVVSSMRSLNDVVLEPAPVARRIIERLGRNPINLAFELNEIRTQYHAVQRISWPPARPA